MTSHHPTKFAIIGAQVSTPNWTGAPMTLAWHDSAAMPQTPNGSTVLGWQNQATQNNDGTLALTSGGNPPQFLDAPQGSLLPSILVQNYNANNLNLTNLSANKSTPIWIEMFGPGLPGPTPTPITAGSAPVPINPGATGSGKAPPNWAQLILQSNTTNLTIVTLIGGPNDASGNNAYVFALNYQGPPNPTGYTKATGSNTISYPFYWTTTFFVANMSPSNSAAVQVSLISL